MKIKFLIIVSLLYSLNVYAYDNEKVHQTINESAAIQSQNFINVMKTLGFRGNTPTNIIELNLLSGKNIKDWFHDGAKLEDETDCRSKFHFHDPTKSWDTAGLSNAAIDTFCLDYTHRSSLVWAQNTGNLWTWQKARQYYHDALTNPDRNMREQNLARTFRSLGQVMHLISDSSVPAHVRNDIHVFPYTVPGIGLEIGDPTFESWARDNYKSLNYTGLAIDGSMFSQAVFHSSAPIAISALWDVDKYTGSNPAVTTENIVGLAEYSNANFFSEDTIFADYSYPAWSSVAEYDEIIDITTGKSRTYLRKVRDGETINHLAAGKWFYKYLPSAIKRSGLKLDEQVYKDYAQKLIPRAVGYSAGLLDYFFRGSMEITLPNTGIYAQTNNPNQGFTRVTLLAKNTTPSNEQMNDGSIELVVKYKLAQSDPFHSIPPPVSNEFSYIVASEANGVRSISRDNPVELAFDLSQTPIPLYATDVYLQVVYNGRLGMEGGATAVGFKDIGEPTPIDEFNNMDRICINGQWYVAGSQEAYNALPESAKWWDYWPHDLKDEYIRISPISNPGEASPTGYIFYNPLIEVGALYRVFILSDYEFVHSGYGTMSPTDTRDDNDHALAIKKATAQGAAVRNQEEFSTDHAFCSNYGLNAPCTVRRTSLFYPFRGVEIWGPGGFITDGLSYPNYTDPGYIPCSWNALAQ